MTRTMRILHTADWHLGKKLNENIELIDVQEHLLQQILDILNEEKLDVFVLAGDIYQTIQVSDEATRLLNEFLREAVLKHRDTYFILINGNHDPAEKLNFGSDLMVENLKIISRLNYNNLPISINKDGIIYDFYPIPFYRVNDYRFQPSINDSIRETKDIYQHIFKQLKLNKQHKNILITHTAIDFMNRQERTDSEEDTYGNVGLVPSDLFSDFDLVLLGHYHKYQKLSDNIYYSGSIYKYSEREYNHKKGILIHDLENNKSSFVPLTPSKDLHYIEGTFMDLINKIYKQYEKNQLENDYFFIQIDENNLIPYVKDELSKYYKNIAGISYKSENNFTSSSKINITHKEINQLDDLELFKKFLEFIFFDEENNTDLEANIQEYTGFSKEDLVKSFKSLWDEFLNSSNY